MTKFVLIRHATTDSVGNRLSGRATGVHLNEAGREQAQILAGQLSQLPISAIYSSPLERARQTADSISALLDLQTVIWDDFLEIDFGEWTNLTFDKLNQLPEFRQFNTFRSFTRVPGGETMAEAQARMINGLEKLCTMHPEATVAIVSHSDLIKATIAYYAGIHLDMFQRIEISPASVSIVEIGNDCARIQLVNFTGNVPV